MMEKRMKADASPELTDLVLIGGGHSHVHVLRMLGTVWKSNLQLDFNVRVIERLGMEPLEGVRLTLVTRDVETPYSGMLPGHVAGFYDRDECHIDLNALARFARCRLIDGEVTRVDVDAKELVLKDAARPRIPYDVLSINVGIAPKGASSSSSALLTPVKPIATFSEKWDGLLEKMAGWTLDRAPYDLVVVGGGAGGVELALAMVARAPELGAGKDRIPSRFALVARSAELLGATRRACGRSWPGRWTGPACTSSTATRPSRRPGGGGKAGLACRLKNGAATTVPFDECVWCTQAAAAPWLGASGFGVDADGFLRVSGRQRCGLAGDVAGTRASTRVYAAGDCASVDGHPRPKAGVFAVMAGMALYANLVAGVCGSPTPRTCPRRRSSACWARATAPPSRRGAASPSRRPGSGTSRTGSTASGCGSTKGLPDLSERDGDFPPFAAATKAGGDALAVLKAAPMRCGGCGAKVGASALTRALANLPKSLTFDNGTPPPCDVVVGVDAPDDGAVVAYGPEKDQRTQVVHTVDFFRSFVSDPYVFGQIAANHALSDCDAMGALPASALALVVVPYGSNRCVEDTLFQLMSGARWTPRAALWSAATRARARSSGWASPSTACRTAARPSCPRRAWSRRRADPHGRSAGAVFAGDMRALSRAAEVRECLASMTQSNRAAATELKEHGCTSCTDVTGFGLLGHLAEMCRASGGARVELSLAATPVFAGAKRLARDGVFSSLQDENLRAKRAVENHGEAVELDAAAYALLFDPQTAGGLLATVPADRADAALAAIRRVGCAAVIGTVAAVDAAHFPAKVAVV
ncbi:selenide water dikinase [Aureococcus anophagefferens]|nr:selenide water dikinase [Aureococcus anophagefferens]